MPLYLPHYLSASLFPKTPAPSVRLSPLVFIHLSSLPQSADLFLCPIHLSTYLSLFPICLFRHLSPPNSSELAVCRERCSARVNGSAGAVGVNTSECFPAQHSVFCHGPVNALRTCTDLHWMSLSAAGTISDKHSRQTATEVISFR